MVKRLKSRAARHGVSMEEEHRKILRQALLGKASEEASFVRFLRTIPEVGEDSDFERDADTGRSLDL